MQRLDSQRCLLDCHAQYFYDPKDGKLAAFLLGMQKCGTRHGAYALWLNVFPLWLNEFSKPLGAPAADMASATASWQGAKIVTRGRWLHHRLHVHSNLWQRDESVRRPVSTAGRSDAATEPREAYIGRMSR